MKQMPTKSRSPRRGTGILPVDFDRAGTSEARAVRSCHKIASDFTWASFLTCIAVAMLAIFATQVQARVAIDQAMPDHFATQHSPASQSATSPSAAFGVTIDQLKIQNRTVFTQQIQLARFRLLAVQHLDQIKILDSWARQSLEAITHHKKYRGEDPLLTALDMTFRPECWYDQNIIYVQAVPIRQRLGQLIDSPAERQRVLHEATISPAFLDREDVKAVLQEIAQNVRLAREVETVANAYNTFMHLGDTLLILPGQSKDETWHHPLQLMANVPDFAAQQPNTPPVAGFSPGMAGPVIGAYLQLWKGWVTNDATLANTGIDNLCAIMPVAPMDDSNTYPSSFARNLELIYNRTFNGTIICVFIYFIAMVLFLVAAIGANPRARTSAMLFFTAAVAFHAAFMLARWYLAGRIPIQNQFESVLGSALLGCVVGFVIEVRKRNALFGFAFSFVGFLAMTACFVVPFAVGKNIGENIGTVAAVLQDYWLYIHVNIVIGSYALIAASFCLGLMYLAMRYWYGMTGHGGNTPLLATSGGLPVMGYAIPNEAALPATTRRFLEQLDAANVVVLQLAFLMLGTGIMCGAVWADHSWGRPWGWDPKETFALVTWIVYLLIVHIRFVTPRDKALWTAWLSIVGFAIMMFNWIGVNFFLVGLHSYA